MTENTVRKKEGGLSCSYKDCGNRFYQMEKGKRIFFSFPKDHEMCKVWLKASGREDLLNTDMTRCHKNRRLCFMHFDDNMYERPNKTRLLSSAVPKQYLPVLGESSLKQIETASAGSASTILEESNKVLSEELNTSDSFGNIDSTTIFQEPSTSKLSTHTDSSGKRKFSTKEESSQDTSAEPNKKIRLSQHLIVTPQVELDGTVSLAPKMSPVETQTPSILSRRSPRKRKLQSDNVKLREENKKLRK